MKLTKKILSAIFIVGLSITPFTKVSVAASESPNDGGKYPNIGLTAQEQLKQYEDKGIKIIKPEGYVELNDQLWDGFKDKENTTLVSNKNGVIRIKKVDKEGNPVEGVQFKVYTSEEDAINEENEVTDMHYYFNVNTTTDERGVVELHSLLFGEYWVKEVLVPEGSNLDAKKDKDSIIHLYVDDGFRFLGEISNNDLIVEGSNNKKINNYLQSIFTNGIVYNSDTNWLVFNDNGKELLIPKKPLKYEVRFDDLYNNGLLLGDEVDFEGIKPNSYDMTSRAKPYVPKYVVINNKKYLVRAFKVFPDYIYEIEKMMLPIIKKGDNFGRYDPDSYYDFFVPFLPEISSYSWREDLNSGDYGYGKMHYEVTSNNKVSPKVLGAPNSIFEYVSYNVYRGGYMDFKKIGWQPILEEVVE